MKVPFLTQTVIVIVCLRLPSEDSVVYSFFTLLLFLWMGMILLDIWKFLFYKDTEKSCYVTPETHMYFEQVLFANGFEIVMENA